MQLKELPLFFIQSLKRVGILANREILILHNVPLVYNIFYQGCYCERLITPGNNHSNQSNGAKQGKEYEEKMVS